MCYLARVAAEQQLIHQFDIDAMYKRHIKSIYSAIIAFICDTAFTRREEPSEQINWFVEANTSLVEAVKDSGQLQENHINFVGSDNRVMHDIYNLIRAQIALCIRELEETQIYKVSL